MKAESSQMFEQAIRLKIQTKPSVGIAFRFHKTARCVPVDLFVRLVFYERKC